MSKFYSYSQEKTTLKWVRKKTLPEGLGTGQHITQRREKADKGPSFLRPTQLAKGDETSLPPLLKIL